MCPQLRTLSKRNKRYSRCIAIKDNYLWKKKFRITTTPQALVSFLKAKISELRTFSILYLKLVRKKKLRPELYTASGQY